MTQLQLSYTEETKNTAATITSGETVSLQDYLDHAYQTLFASKTGYTKPRNVREYNLMLSFLLATAKAKKTKEIEKVFTKIFMMEE